MQEPTQTLIAAIEATQQRLHGLQSASPSIDESNTVRLLIDPILSALDWDLLDITQVMSEYRHKPSDNPVDYALFSNGRPVLFVEAKALGKNLDDRKWISQTINYANTANVEWAVLTNGAEWRIYKTHAQVEADKKLFYTSTIANQPTEVIATQLLPLARDKFDSRSELCSLWETASIDSKLREALGRIHTMGPVVRALAKATKLSPADTKRGLERLLTEDGTIQIMDLFSLPAPKLPTKPTGRRPNKPVEGTHIQDTPAATPGTPDAEVPMSPVLVVDNTAHLNPVDAQPTTPAAPPDAAPPSMADLLASGSVQEGQHIHIHTHPHAPAVVINAQFCHHNGMDVSYSVWARTVTGEKILPLVPHLRTETGQPLWAPEGTAVRA